MSASLQVSFNLALVKSLVLIKITCKHKSCKANKYLRMTLCLLSTQIQKIHVSSLRSNTVISTNSVSTSRQALFRGSIVKVVSMIIRSHSPFLKKNK